MRPGMQSRARPRNKSWPRMRPGSKLRSRMRPRSELRPRMRKPLLARILAYRLQANAFGDLPDTVRRTLDGFGARSSARGGQAGGDSLSFQRRIKPAPSWFANGMAVSSASWRWRKASLGTARTYRSLSKVARAITGGHWSGPRFFGLTGSGAMAPLTHSETRTRSRRPDGGSAKCNASRARAQPRSSFQPTPPPTTLSTFNAISRQLTACYAPRR